MDMNSAIELAKSAFSSQLGNEPVIGLDFNHSQIFALEIAAKKNRQFVNRFGLEPAVAKLENLDQAIARLFEKGAFTSSRVNIALSGSVVLVRFIEYPKMNLEELKNSMRFQVEQYIPFQADDVITDFHILGDSRQDHKKMRVILVAAKKTEIMSLIETLQKAKLSIQAIDIHAFACLNAFTFSQPEAKKENASILLDIGRLTSSLLILEKGEPAFIREIAIGNQEVQEVFRKKAGSSGAQPMADEIKRAPAFFAEACEPLFSQIRLSVNYFMSHHTGIDAPKAIYLSGDLCGYPEFCTALKKSLGLETKLWECMRQVDQAGFEEGVVPHRYALPVSFGLALRSEG